MEWLKFLKYVTMQFTPLSRLGYMKLCLYYDL